MASAPTSATSVQTTTIELRGSKSIVVAEEEAGRTAQVVAIPITTTTTTTIPSTYHFGYSGDEFRKKIILPSTPTQKQPKSRVRRASKTPPPRKTFPDVTDTIEDDDE